MSQNHVHYRYIGAFVDALAAAGMRNVCFAPGSRSTPLAVMMAEHPEITLWTHLDERSAGFFALGMAKASQTPVGLVCSSGTATANFYPAVIEARYSRVPLIVMTADRPPELQDVGAPQTIDQNQLYADHPKWATTVALPEDTPEMLRYAQSLGGRAVSTALAAPAGPVHLNFPFREPLMPIRPEDGAPVSTTNVPRFTASRAPRAAEQETIEHLANEIPKRPNGLIVCGPDDRQLSPQAIVELGRTLGYPILADPLSGVRCGADWDDIVIDASDAFLRDRSLVKALAPDLIIRFGAMPTSKPYLLYSQKYAEVLQYLVDSGEGWNDPALHSHVVVHAEPTLFCEQLQRAIAQSDFTPRESWLSDWITINHVTRHVLSEQMERGGSSTASRNGREALFEGRVFHELATLLPNGSTLFAGNSMPVRDMDTFYPGSSSQTRFLSNRGANGIDGVISSALGASSTSDDPLVLVIGDLSFYHDMNGLLAAKLHDIDATIVLINNDGGGIFSFLPQASHPEHFEALFGTPHGLDFEHAAALYGLEFSRIDSWQEFRTAVSQSIEQRGVQLIEVPAPDRETNVRLHRELWSVMSDALSEVTLECRVTS